VKAQDVTGGSARYFLVGAVTWAVPLGIVDLKDAAMEEEVPEEEIEEARLKRRKKIKLIKEKQRRTKRRLKVARSQLKNDKNLNQFQTQLKKKRVWTLL
jgi:hypothetical protein